MTDKAKFIGFPPPLLGASPLRLPVCYDDGDLIAVEKPIDVLTTQDNWYPRLPVLIEAIRYQASNQKRELVELGVGSDGLWAINDLDPEIQGPVLFARNRERSDFFKNELGSGRFRFVFSLVSERDPGEKSLFCDLPIARHQRQAAMLVSHTTGKKCSTTFEKVGFLSDRYSLWQAECDFYRLHQIRLHAFEVGLQIVGDEVYGGSQSPYLSQLKRSFRRSRKKDEQPLLNGPALYLKSIHWGNGLSIEGQMPNRLSGFLKQLSRLAGQD